MPSLRALKDSVPKLSLSDMQRVRFVGEKALTGDKEALTRAKEMQSAGVDRDTIWRETGWGIGPSGKWMSETDDREFRVSPAGRQALEADLATDLSEEDEIPHHAYADIFEDPAIADYPELARTRVTAVPDGGPIAGALWPGSGARGSSIGIVPSQSAEELRRTGLHETQHNIDLIEGNAPPNHLALSYEENPMEVLARTAERRADLTPEERRARPPWQSYDVGEGDIGKQRISSGLQSGLDQLSKGGEEPELTDGEFEALIDKLPQARRARELYDSIKQQGRELGRKYGFPMSDGGWGPYAFDPHDVLDDYGVSDQDARRFLNALEELKRFLPNEWHLPGSPEWMSPEQDQAPETPVF